MSNLVADTELTDQGGGSSSRLLHRDWEIWGPNGGYMASLALRAASTVSGRARPANISVHFLGVASFDEPVLITTVVLRSTRLATSVRVSIMQAGKPILEAMIWSVDADLPGLAHDHALPPNVESPLELPSIQERFAASGFATPPTRYRFWDNFEQRTTEWIGDWDHRGQLDPVYLNWMRFIEGAWNDPWLDACRLVLLVDLGGWPATDRAHVDSAMTARSLDVSCEFHRFDPAANWLLLRGTSSHAGDGLVATHQSVWNESGQMLASGISHLLCRPMR